MARRPRVQVCKKRLMAACFFCGQRDPATLDAHRIIPGAEGGKYTTANVMVVCSVCHRKIHAGSLVILARHTDTLGRPFIRFVENGAEQFRLEIPARAEPNVLAGCPRAR